MELMFGLFALLPLALFSFLSKGLRADATCGIWGLLAPALTTLAGNWINRKGDQSAQQQKIDYDRRVAEQKAAQQEAQARAAWEARQSSPQAAMLRLGFNTRLAALLGGFGGRGQTPGFILNAFDTARTPQEYQPGFQSEFIAPPKKGGGLWDYLGDAAGAASYFDTSRYGKGGQGAQATPAPTAQASAPTPASGSAFLPSSFQNRQYAGLETPQFQFKSPEDESNPFLRRRG